MASCSGRFDAARTNFELDLITGATAIHLGHTSKACLRTCIDRPCPTRRILPPLAHAPLLADKGYDSNVLSWLVKECGTMPNIPSKTNRIWKNGFSPVLYRHRNAIGRMPCRLRSFRHVASRYDRDATNILATICIAAAFSFWL
ncbi:MAG: hypothetical protein LCH38_14420 [Proteobacteria bacterium]|nr:hypothetical protein [Pseudomonadota bacterium]